MSILVFADNNNGTFKKAAYEAVFYASKLADGMQSECHALVIGDNEQAGELGAYGADKVHQIAGNTSFNSAAFTKAIAAVAEKLNAEVVVLAHSADGKSLAGRLAVRLKAGLVSGSNSIPDVTNGFRVTKSVFSGKATVTVEIQSERKVVSVMPNSLSPQKTGEAVQVEKLDIDLENSAVEVIGRDTVEGHVPLPEAEVVVSAGRGMKGPENWEIIEELADVMGATTACSRPVADVGWRPHHEHVGQTGIAIRPNLYMAIGISGAIQHLAGVNNSKVIVVINKDPEAPFFKAADYGICADLFDVVPKLTDALRKFKATEN